MLRNTLIIVGLGILSLSMSKCALQKVQAQTQGCSLEFFFDIPSNNAIENTYTTWFATDACILTTQVDQTYTTKKEHTVQSFTLQMGSNTGSVFEWDLVFTVTRPDGVIVLQQQQQYDKHVDNIGNIQKTYNLVSPVTLPTGSTLRLVRRSESQASCIKAGPWGSSEACATGQSVQLQDIVK